MYRTPRRPVGKMLAGASAALAVLVLSSCTSSTNAGEAAVTSDSKATLVVWTDATRQAGFEEYQKENPSVKMKVELYDPGSLLTKVQLANRTGSGWPDVVFDGTPNDVAALSSSLYKYTADLSSLIPKSVQQDFGESNSSCTIDGKLVCLKNDLAQTVLWYNKPLMDQFGYSVPTTWDEYEALGEKVAKEHPGYIIGAAGGSTVYYNYFWPSGCPLQTVVNETQVNIDTTDTSCTRVASMLDTLLANGSVTRAGEFDADTVALGQSQHVLMMPGAAWYGDFLFKPDTGYATPEGVLAAAAYPTWGSDKPYSGAAGGGIYMVSSHSKNIKGAAAIAQFMATSDKVQSSAPTYPAYGPAADTWSERVAADGFYAEDPVPVLKAQAQLINPAESPTRYSIEGVITATVVQAAKSGGSVTDALPDLQSQLAGLAQSTGYAVK